MANEPFLVRFAREWGWRAYAIPVLAVLTVVVLFDVFTNPDAAEESAPGTETQTISQSSDETQRSGPIPDGEFKGNPDVGALPPGGPYTEKSSGQYKEVGSAGPKVGEGTTKTYRYAVTIEDSIDTHRIGGVDAFAGLVRATLSDPRSWTHDPAFAFEPVTLDDNPDLVIQLSSTDTAHQECGYAIPLETSCHVGSGGNGPNKVVVNEARWVRGALPFEGDVGSYRQYLINHEVGHAIGFAAHEACAEDGGVAPIMMQQTLSTSNSELYQLNPNEVYPDDGARCKSNPWPYPTA
ncbi:DUF3152 domain-containing protein [Corynebacterium sp. H113]|uniref:DUF3152 domain-containing protein n=1 Tax=Corynebacterium sp. H113 TaxID=3133419 RepID=UPI00309B876E